MPKDYSPFTPGQPAPVEFFVGRRNEVDRLKSIAGSAARGKLQVAFLTGERGIGKSSLASIVRFLAERDERILGIHAFLGGVDSLEEMARRIFDRLVKETSDTTWFGKVKSFFGDRVQKVGLFGVTFDFNPPRDELQRLVHNFAASVREFLDRIKDEKKGLLLVLDDINGLAESAAFAHWLKSLVDEIATSGKPLALCILLVGLEDRRQSLIQIQPSLARVFDAIEIRAWDEQESREFFKTTFEKVKTPVDGDALDLLSLYAGGLPVLAHEIGDAVFRTDDDNRIDRKDALRGIVAAAEVVGRKHLEPQVFDAIRSARYRSILRKLAGKHLALSFNRGDLKKLLTEDEAKVLNNFLTRMKELGVIQPEADSGPGHFGFRNRLHHLYLSLEAARAQREA